MRAWTENWITLSIVRKIAHTLSAFSKPAATNDLSRPLVTMAKPAKKPATFVAKGITALGRSQTYKRCAASKHATYQLDAPCRAAAVSHMSWGAAKYWTDLRVLAGVVCSL
jgi:hypothetical protein